MSILLGDVHPELKTEYVNKVLLCMQKLPSGVAAEIVLRALIQMYCHLGRSVEALIIDVHAHWDLNPDSISSDDDGHRIYPLRRLELVRELITYISSLPTAVAAEVLLRATVRKWAEIGKTQAALVIDAQNRWADECAHQDASRIVERTQTYFARRHMTDSEKLAEARAASRG